ncbi:MAG: DNA mismatch repair protein MutS [Rectinemataceae bacterium]|jgi:DNA mismatch repair protein MutS
MAERTPMMDQYRAIKSRHRDAVLFFRLGDFYEMFFDDAIEASSLLDLTLTHRQGEPMCGVPYHAARSYIARLLKHGKKVAICEQLSEPGLGKGIVERDVIEVVTPGTTVEEDFLDQVSNNYLVAACRLGGRLCIAYLDVSTGEFRAFSRPESDAAGQAQALRSELYRLSPREMLVQQSLLEDKETAEAIGEIEGLVVGKYPDWSFDPAAAASDIARRFGVVSLKGFGFDEGAPELAAAGALLRYVDETARSKSPHLSPPLPYRDDDYLSIDEGSRKNLEIVRNMSDSGRAFSLIAVLDHTKTSPGARLLRNWLLQPLRSRNAAEARLEAVDFLYRDQRLLSSLRESLGSVRDIERLASRVAMDKAHAKDLLALAESIRACAASGALLRGPAPPCLVAGEDEREALSRASAIAELTEAAIMDEPSILLTEGDLIRDGFDAELDRLRSLKAGSREILDTYIEEEKAATRIPTLRVRFNRIIGYYLEVSKGKLDSVPAHFIRRQSLVAGERYTTARLTELESEINGATERIVDLERRLFLGIREKAKAEVASMLVLGRAWAARDCLASFAWAATLRGYTRPRLVDEPVLRITEGRHPVVEAHLPEGYFVPNSITLDSSIDRQNAPAFALITGPNMAGKSTFLRQTALIALMAQAGSFVPALDAEIGMMDKIYCRVGAQDNLARGESTFLVEMHETAFILNTATDHSLVVMDEVGRGTSTIDGLAIAWAVSESILDTIRCRALFATHYHELTALAHPRLRNFSLAVLEEEDEIVFLKKLEERPAEGSYGIHVAKLAGLPSAVLERARQIQGGLEAKELSLPPVGDPNAKTNLPKVMSPAQGGLFSPGDLVLAELASIDTDKLTPLEALNRIATLKKRLQS